MMAAAGLMLSLAACGGDRSGAAAGNPGAGVSGGAVNGPAGAASEPTAADYVEAPLVLTGGRTPDGLVSLRARHARRHCPPVGA